MKLSKSKLALAKVINENGGWVDESSYAANDEGGIICGYSSKPNRSKLTSYFWSGGKRNTWIRGIKTHQWHQVCLSREEYYHAYPKADADGWIEWKGGECPVDDCLIVEVEYNGGGVASAAAKSFSWAHEWEYSNITKYRLHKPEVKPEFCESVMRSIPEPEAKPTIEQLAHEYRNKLGFANRKQQEADDAKAAADAALGELERAGRSLWLVIGIANPESELVISCWSDLRIGDEVECTEYDHEHRYGVVCRIDETSEKQPIMVVHGDGKGISRPSSWKFIRRP